MPRKYIRKQRYPKAYGSRYMSSRRYPGLYRSTSSYSLVGQALKRIGRYKLRQAIKSVAEKKWYDNVVNLSAAGNLLSNVGFMFSLTDMPQGSGQSNRVGDKATGSSLEIRLTLTSPTAGTTVANIVFRLIIFVWKDDTVPTLADILEGIGATPPDSPFNHDYAIKRKVLYDSCTAHYIDPVTKSCQNPIRFKKIILPLNKLKRGLNIVNFQAGTTIAVNHIYALMVSDTPNTANQTWTLEASFRYNYIDM